MINPPNFGCDGREPLIAPLVPRPPRPDDVDGNPSGRPWSGLPIIKRANWVLEYSGAKTPIRKATGAGEASIPAFTTVRE